jgi:putative hydrolase of the HAD superfamily
VKLAPSFRVSGVTFDFWETLFMDTPELDRRREELRCQGLRENLAKAGVSVSIEDLTSGFGESNAWLVDIWKRGEQVSTLEQIRYIVNHATKNRATLPTDLGVLRRLEESYWSPSLTEPATLNFHAREVLQRLHELSLKIGLICNTGRETGHVLRELMRREGVLDYFDATVFSNEVGHGKPDKRIFLTAADKMGLKPTDVLHVGDNIENDVKGAQSAGMKTLLFDYEVPLGFREQPSLLALTRASDAGEEIKPDGRIKSLSEILKFIR